LRRARAPFTVNSSHAVPAPESPPRSSRDRRPELVGRRVLMVDDDRLNLRILRAILQGEGYILEEARSGEEALEKYDSFRPDLVLLDVEMAGINGFETCRTLKARHTTDAAPVVFITARTESDDVVEGFRAGGVDYLSKPFHANEAVARIRTHLQNRVFSEQLLSLVDQLGRANAAKNRFLGMAAHDLRNPLASIRGLAEFLLEPSIGPLNDEQREMVSMIHTTSHDLLKMVNELLDVATIEAGELKIRPELVSLVDLVQKSVHLMGMEAARKKSSIRLQVLHAPPTLTLDPAKVRQVIDNLLSNAIKYSPPQSVIVVEVDHDRTAARLSVKDQGPGIPESERDLLFKDFGRLSAKPTAGEKSTGLGLAICKNIVDAHHGSINAENLPERGCEFRVTFPLPA
jgi:two-component system, sensor histidine kinase and response regulator